MLDNVVISQELCCVLSCLLLIFLLPLAGDERTVLPWLPVCAFALNICFAICTTNFKCSVNTTVWLWSFRPKLANLCSQVNTWAGPHGKNGMRRDWHIHDAMTGHTVLKTTRGDLLIATRIDAAQINPLSFREWWCSLCRQRVACIGPRQVPIILPTKYMASWSSAWAWNRCD